jgi:hypothetical protein
MTEQTPCAVERFVQYDAQFDQLLDLYHSGAITKKQYLRRCYLINRGLRDIMHQVDDIYFDAITGMQELSTKLEDAIDAALEDDKESNVSLEVVIGEENS